MKMLDTTFRNQANVDDSVVAIDVTSVLGVVRTDDRKYTATIIDESPSVLPPFGSMWMEYARTRKVAVGVHFRTHDLRDIPEKDRVAELFNHVLNESPDAPVYAKPLRDGMGDPAFGIEWSMYIRDIRLDIIQVGRFAMTLNDQGRPAADATIWSVPIGGKDYIAASASAGYDVYQSLDAFFFAIGLLHCKNVSTSDSPQPPEKLLKRQTKRAGVPPFKYKVLEIGGLSQAGGNTSDSPVRISSEKMLHICRGNFATYSADKPLFGKYIGTFWRPAHVRGSSDVGTVYKDYKVKA